MIRFLTPKDIVNVEDIITVLVIVSIVFSAFTRLRQNSARIS